MSKPQISELREHLFDALKQLSAKKNPMEIERARAISEVAQTIINSAKVEVDYMKVAGVRADTGFISAEPEQKKLTTTGKLT